jgi:hypothetical protein
MEDKKMTKFYEEMQKINISNDEVSKINEIYLKLLNKAFELNIDFPLFIMIILKSVYPFFKNVPNISENQQRIIL